VFGIAVVGSYRPKGCCVSSKKERGKNNLGGDARPLRRLMFFRWIPFVVCKKKIRAVFLSLLFCCDRFFSVFIAACLIDLIPLANPQTRNRQKKHIFSYINTKG